MQIPPTLGVPLARQHPDGVTFTPNDKAGFTRYTKRKVSEISAPVHDTAYARVIRAHEICHAVSSPHRVAWQDDYSFFALQATEDLHVHALFKSRGLTTNNPAFCRDCKAVYFQEMRSLQGPVKLIDNPAMHPMLAMMWPQLVLQILRAESLDVATIFFFPPCPLYPFRRHPNMRDRRDKMWHRTKSLMEKTHYRLLRTDENHQRFHAIMSWNRDGKNKARINLRHTCEMIQELIDNNPWVAPPPTGTPRNKSATGDKPSGRKALEPNGMLPEESELLRYFPPDTTYEVDPDLRVIIIRPPLTRSTTERLRAKTRAARSGTKIRFRGLLNRLIDPSSNSPLYRKRSREFAGSIMIDYSGSMPLDTQVLTDFCESLPFGTIRYYYGPAPIAWQGQADGIIVEWAKNGKRAEKIFARDRNGNEIDVSAYYLLMRDPAPRFFVDDEGECGANFDPDSPGYRMSQMKFRKMRTANSEAGIVHHINVDSPEQHVSGLHRMDWAIKKIRSLLH